MSDLSVAAINHHAIRERVRASEPDIDERTLADTVEGLRAMDEPWRPGSRSGLWPCRGVWSACRIGPREPANAIFDLGESHEIERVDKI
jgi:hypothetical protein